MRLPCNLNRSHFIRKAFQPFAIETYTFHFHITEPATVTAQTALPVVVGEAMHTASVSCEPATGNQGASSMTAGDVLPGTGGMRPLSALAKSVEGNRRDLVTLQQTEQHGDDALLEDKGSRRDTAAVCRDVGTKQPSLQPQPQEQKQAFLPAELPPGTAIEDASSAPQPQDYVIVDSLRLVCI